MASKRLFFREFFMEKFNLYNFVQILVIWNFYSALDKSKSKILTKIIPSKNYYNLIS